MINKFLNEIKEKINSNETIILHIRGEERQGMSSLAHKMGSFSEVEIMKCDNCGKTLMFGNTSEDCCQ